MIIKGGGSYIDKGWSSIYFSEEGKIIYFITYKCLQIFTSMDAPQLCILHNIIVSPKQMYSVDNVV